MRKSRRSKLLAIGGMLALVGSTYGQSTPEIVINNPEVIPQTTTISSQAAPPMATPLPAGVPATMPAAMPASMPMQDAAGAPCNTCAPAGGAGAALANPWAKVPAVSVFPRPGVFPVPPSGPGYYSFMDLLTDTYREKPPALPYGAFALYPPSFFNSDFRYLDKPDNQQHDFFDCTKRIHPTDDTMISFGGQHWVRFMNETDSRLGRPDNSYLLMRNRVYMDAWYQDLFRVYAEFLSGTIAGNDIDPLPIDRNRADVLNAFVDVKALTIDGSPLYVRAGRQELLYGSQRLVSTLDWANTRRTFDGVKAFWHSEKFDVDAFAVRPVTIKPTDVDSSDHNQLFWGTWFTYRPEKGKFCDLYYLGLDNTNIQRNPLLPATGPNSRRGTINLHTFGARAAGNEGQFLYDFEGMYQTGEWLGQTHSAHAFTTAVGYNFKDMPWTPQVWVGNDYASGSSNIGRLHGTFQQLFPFGHYYLGFLDLVGRQNINDFNLNLTMYPHNWITVIAQYHHFTLADKRDFLYNAAGRNTRRSANGTAGRDVGDEIDLRCNLHLSQHSDFLFGYSKLFSGDFIKRTGAVVNPELFYMMYNFRW
jgi:hypothetical protein